MNTVEVGTSGSFTVASRKAARTGAKGSRATGGELGLGVRASTCCVQDGVPGACFEAGSTPLAASKSAATRSVARGLGGMLGAAAMSEACPAI
jgi:hypothetical protein